MNKLFYLFGFLVIVMLFPSCGNSNQPSSGDYMPEIQLAVIKMPAEAYKQVFVSPIVDSVVVDFSALNLNTLFYRDSLALCAPTQEDTILSDFAQSQLNLLGTNPYVILDNGYAIIDWKWSHFHPLSGAIRNVLYCSPVIYDHKRANPGYSTNRHRNGTLANEEYYLLPLGWQELKTLTSTWALKEGERIEKPEVRYINLTDIEKYGNYKITHKEIRQKYNTENDLHSVRNLYVRDAAMFVDYVEVCDKLQSSYVQTLNQMINNNDFENDHN